MGIVIRLLCISLLVGICLAVVGTPQPKAQSLNPEPRLTEISKLSQQIKASVDKKQDDQEPEDCDEPPPRRCRWWNQQPHDPSNPNSPGWVKANVVGAGQLPDDVKAKLPRWITARTVPFLPDDATGESSGPCCICPQCGLSFYTPNDYWGHIPQCVVPGPRPCVQTTQCLGQSHFDPSICMCRKGAASSSAAAPVPFSSSSSSGVSGTNVTGVTGVPDVTVTGGNSTVNDTSTGDAGGGDFIDVESIITGSIGLPSSTGGYVSLVEAEHAVGSELPDVQEIGEEIGDIAADQIEAGVEVGP